MRIVHVITRLPGSGTERQLLGTLLAARAEGLWEPTLCVLRPGYRLSEEGRAAGLDVIELRPTARWDVEAMVALRRLVRSGRFDVVHSSLWGANVRARVAAAGPARPTLVVSERRVEEDRPGWARAVDRRLRSSTDAYIGNSDDVVDFITRAHSVPRSLVTVVRNGIDSTVFYPAAPRVPPAAAEQQSAAAPQPGAQQPAAARQPLRIGVVGRLVRQKGIDVLLAALPTVLSRHPEVEVHVVGEGPLRSELEAAAVGLPVVFEGFIDERFAVAAFLRSLDVFVLPSRFEGLPNAVIEASACGVPAVATDVAGMREATLGRARLVPPEDPGALGAAINEALDELAEPAHLSPLLPLSTRTFVDVARDHHAIFVDAMARRGIKVRSRS